MLNSSTSCSSQARKKTNITAYCQKSAKLRVLQEWRWTCDLNLRLEYIICYDTGLWFTVGPESIQELLLKKDFKQCCTSPVTLQLFVSRHPSNMADGHGMADMSGGTGLGKKGRERDCKEQTNIWISHSISEGCWTGWLSRWHSVLKLTQQSPVN